LALVGYIVEEAVLTLLEGETHSQQTIDKMESRLALLPQCASGGQEMAAVARYLVGIVSAKTGLVLFLKLYIQFYCNLINPVK
jgi:hypothetical protein